MQNPPVLNCCQVQLYQMHPSVVLCCCAANCKSFSDMHLGRWSSTLGEVWWRHNRILKVLVFCPVSPDAHEGNDLAHTQTLNREIRSMKFVKNTTLYIQMSCKIGKPKSAVQERKNWSFTTDGL